METTVSIQEVALGNGPIPDFRPTRDRLLIKFLSPEAANGVVLPDNVKAIGSSLGNWGRVVRKGPGLLRPDGTYQEILIPLGAKVALPPHMIIGITINREHWVVCHEAELLGVLVDEQHMTEREFTDSFLAHLMPRRLRWWQRLLRGLLPKTSTVANTEAPDGQ